VCELQDATVCAWFRVQVERVCRCGACSFSRWQGLCAAAWGMVQVGLYGVRELEASMAATRVLEEQAQAQHDSQAEQVH
jgi:hypothetical protein